MVSLSKARLRRSTALVRSRRYISLNPLRYDPTRTTTIQRTFEEQFFKRFSKFQRELVKLLVSDDALGLKRMTLNTFCPTGKGGGIDPTCSLKGKKGKKAAKKKVKVTKSRFVEITDLTGSQARSLLNYSNFSASSINAGLRNGEIKEQQIVDDIDAVMLKSKTPKALTVYRGVQETYSFKPQNSKVGDTVEFLSYGSTSSSQYIAHMAARQYDYDDKGVVYRINLPKGSNVIDMSRVARSDEGEYLLPRNSKFKVSKIDSGEIDNEYGHDIIHLEPLNPTINTSWKFDSTQEKIDNFEQWIISKLTETMEDKDIHSGLDWWQMYIDRAFRMGSNQGYTAVKGKSLSKDPRASDQALGAKNQAMSMIYGMPATKERLKILTGRTFKGMKGLTDMMKTQLTQELTDGLIQGLSPRAIADNLVKRIGINKNRAMTIARTETVRSYNEGNLATFKALGVKNIGVKVEILVSGKACPKCQKLKGKIFTLEKAEGLLPVHPNCFITPGVKIYTVDGWKSIGNIEVGDLVLTHKKRFRKVTQLHRNIGTDVHVIDFSIKGIKGPSTISITADHPVMVNKIWKAAKDIVPGDKVRWMSSKCLGCGKPIPFGRKYHNQSCQWKDKAQLTNLKAKTSATLLRQYKDGTRNGHEAVKAAHEKVRALILRGEFDAAGASWGASRGERNGAKQPEARRKISRSKMGDGNAMRTDKDLGRNNGENLKLSYQQDPTSHPNYKAALKARKGDLDSMSGIERKIHSQLLEEGIKAEYNYPVESLWIDFAIVDHKIAIECDGAYWHQDPEKEAKRDQRLEKAGWRVLHLPEKLINSNPRRCLAQITRLLLNHEGEFNFYDFEVVSVSHRNLQSSKLYNFSVEEDESYVAKGCVVHNCTCAYTPYISDEPSPQKERQKSWIERSILSVTRKQPLIGNAKKGWSKEARIKSALVRKVKKKVTGKSSEEAAKRALRGYAYGGDYIEINYALRKGKSLSKQLRSKVKALDEAIAASPKSIKPMTVYRRAFIPDLPKEGIYTDKSFMSTSRDTSGAFIKGHKHWEIRIPVGTPMASIPGRGPAGYGNERELVLPRNGKYKVISNEFNSSGILELLPPNQKKSK